MWPARSRHLQPVGLLVDGDDLRGAEHPGAVHGELADRAGAPHRHHVAGLDVAHLGTHVAGGQDVGEEQHLLVGQVGLDLQRADVGERHPRVLCLTAREAAGQMRIAEDPGDRVAEHLLRDPGVGVGVLAAGVQLGGAGAARAAGDRERHDDPVPDAQPIRIDARADLDHLAHELVAHDVAVLHRGHVPVDQVQVRAADRGGGDPHDGIAAVQDLRVRHVPDLDLVAARPGVRPHASAPFVELGVRQRLRRTLRELLAGPLAPRGAVGADHLAGLQHLLEPAQVVVELLVRFLAEVLGDRLADRAARNVVRQDDVHLGAHTVRGGHEPDRTGVRHVGVPGRPPRDLLAGRLVDDLRVPLDVLAERGAGRPVARTVTGGADLLQMRHERREVLQIAPERVDLRRGFANGRRGRQLHRSSFA